MSETQQIEVSEKALSKWHDLREKLSERLGMDIEEMDSELQTLFSEEKTKHPSHDDTRCFNDAMRRFHIRYKKQLQSPAILFDLIVIGVSSVFDPAQIQRQKALSEYEQDPVETVFDPEQNPDGVVAVYYRDNYINNIKAYQQLTELGVVKSQKRPDNTIIEFCVVPINNRKTFRSGKKNPFYGKPLRKHSYLRNLIGIGTPRDKGEFRLMKITTNDELALQVPQMFKPMQARFNWRPTKEQQENPASIKEYIVSGSKATEYQVVETEKEPDLARLIEDHCSHLFVPIEELEEWHDTHKNDPLRVCIVEADVNRLFLQPTELGSTRMIIDDINLTLLENMSGMTVWCGAEVNIDFGEGSKVLVIGRTNEGRGRDPETGAFSDDFSEIQISAYGVYAIPEYKIEVDAEEVKEEDLFDDEEEEAHQW